MNTLLLIFFALPIAVIVISIALQKILKCPVLVAAIIFSIFLIVTFIISNLTFLVVAIIYAIISFITAWIQCVICRFIKDREDNISCFCRRCGRRENNRNCGNCSNNND